MTTPKAFLISILLLLLRVSVVHAQNKIENLVIITTDGLRWQEVFRGMDSVIADDKKYNQGDSSYIYNKYGAATADESRRRLLPFIWETVARKGQIYGNRQFGNKVNNANPHWFSYPGYSELFTGYADPKINSNSYKSNPHLTVLEFLHRRSKFKNKVAAFGAWDAFDRILNEERAGFPVISAFDPTGGATPTNREQLLNKMLADSYKPWGEAECLDVFTHNAAMEHMRVKRPKVLYIAYGETDEWAHAGQYKSYLDAAHQVDKWLADIWNYVQKNPHYKNKTALLITVDHGRGDKNKSQWTDHGSNVFGASETWFALLGPGITGKGELRQNMQLYQQQLAQTIAIMFELKFTADHPVSPGVDIR